MENPPFKREDEFEDVEETTTPEREAVLEELEDLPAWKEFQNEGMENLTFGDY
jgi:hypothetical protein